MWCQNKAIKGGGRLVFQVTVVVATSEVMILLGSLREREKRVRLHHSSSIAKDGKRLKSHNSSHCEPTKQKIEQKLGMVAVCAEFPKNNPLKGEKLPCL